MRAYLPMLLLFLASGASPQHESEIRRPWNGCGSPELHNRAAPSLGPAHLLRFDCLPLPPTPFTSSPPIISPDGEQFLVHQYARGLFVGSLDNDAIAHIFPFDPTFVQFGGISFTGSTFLYQWASDSRFVWGAKQETGKGHFAAGPLTPVLLSPNGLEQSLPPLLARAGPLDGLIWIGGDGLALAKFGTNGSYYKPEHSDPDPMLAFVDFKRGKVLQRISLNNFPKAVSAFGHPMVPLTIATVRLPDGRPRAVLQWPSGFSLVWTHGSRPREITLPKLPFMTNIALAPGGRKLLISYPVQTVVAVCEDETPCPPPRIVTAKYAELVDIETGKTLWERTGTSNHFGSGLEPAISPNGRYALAGIPEQNGHTIGLISMSDGRVLQTVPSIWSSWTYDFTDNRHFYVSGGSFVASYEIGDR